MPLGAFVLVLHGHLPYVLRHGRWPHGENWLYEAVAETYLPLLAVFDECHALGGQPNIAIGLTPILLEQLASDVFRGGFRRYLDERCARAAADRREFEAKNDTRMARLADRWDDFYAQRRAQFEAEREDLCGAFGKRRAAGLEILSSAATHAYLPLLCQDSSARAQVRAGLASSRRRLGFQPPGFWMPECAYRPRGPWTPPIQWPGASHRPGTEKLLGDEGVSHVFVEHGLVEQSRSTFVRDGERWSRVDADEATKYAGRGWRSVHEPHGIDGENAPPAKTVAFARDATACEQVWSGSIGYPADPAYLEFHKRHGEEGGLRYWRVTGKDVGLHDKQPYEPDATAGRLHAQVTHFCALVKDRLRAHRDRTGRYGVVVAAFDAELFGHWWFEGPRFVRDVLLTLQSDADVDVATPARVLERQPPDKVAALPEGSWGEGSDHRVWADPRVHWLWQIEYRCETAFGRATFDLPWRRNAALQGLLRKAARELLLLQASDWPFAITRGQAVDYGIKRFVLHTGRFDSLLDLCHKVAADPAAAGTLDAVEEHAVADADLHDVVFDAIDLDWWRV